MNCHSIAATAAASATKYEYGLNATATAANPGAYDLSNCPIKFFHIMGPDVEARAGMLGHHVHIRSLCEGWDTL